MEEPKYYRRMRFEENLRWCKRKIKSKHTLPEYVPVFERYKRLLERCLKNL